MFIVGRHLIALYLAYTAPASTYGAAGSLVLVLLWVYYSSLILFFGAAFTKAKTLASGKRVVPRAMAVRVRQEIVADPG
jgi:membrane protein